jgi:hypothetical protein
MSNVSIFYAYLGVDGWLEFSVIHFPMIEKQGGSYVGDIPMSGKSLPIPGTLRSTVIPITA